MKNTVTLVITHYLNFLCTLFLLPSCGIEKKETAQSNQAQKVIFRNPPTGGTLSECIRLALSTEDSVGNTTQGGEAVNISLSASLGKFYSESACTKETSQATIAPNQTSAFVYFKSPTPGTINLKAAETPDADLLDATLNLEIKTDATRLAFSEPAINGLYSKCLPVTLNVLNGSSQSSQLGIKLPVTFTAKYNQDQTTLGEFYKDSKCKESENILEIPADKSEATIYFLTNEPGEYKVTAIIPKGASIDPPSSVDLNARTELFGTWTGPCVETAVGAATRMQKSVTFDDIDLVYNVNYYTGQSGSCIDLEKSHWTNFTATYSLPDHATESSSSSSKTAVSKLDITYKTSCVGVKLQSKAAAYRSSGNCGTIQWQEDANACNDTTGKSGCESGTALTTETAVFDIFEYGTSSTSEIRFSAAQLLPKGTNNAETNRPTATVETPYNLLK